MFDKPCMARNLFSDANIWVILRHSAQEQCPSSLQVTELWYWTRDVAQGSRQFYLHLSMARGQLELDIDGWFIYYCMCLGGVFADAVFSDFFIFSPPFSLYGSLRVILAWQWVSQWHTLTLWLYWKTGIYSLTPQSILYCIITLNSRLCYVPSLFQRCCGLLVCNSGLPLLLVPLTNVATTCHLSLTHSQSECPWPQ